MDSSVHATSHRRTSSADHRRFDVPDLRGVWQCWRQRVRTRAELRAMDARTLTDIGLDPEGARQESRKFFWQC